MQEFVDIISKSKLFANINQSDIEDIINNFKQNVKTYPKNTILFSEGDRVEYLYFVISGKLQIVKYSYAGQKSILMNLSKGDFFAEAVAFSKGKLSPVTVETLSECQVIGISSEVLLETQENYNWSRQLLINLLEISFEKSFALNKKIDILSQRTIRDKFLTFLDLECKMKKSNTVMLPFTKQAISNFLEVDRTALFRVLKQLEEEGIIEIEDKKVTLNQDML